MKSWFKATFLGLKDPPVAAASPPPPSPLWVPAGHFYSPIADLDDLSQRAATVFDLGAPVAGIDFHLDAQQNLFRELAALAAQFELPRDAIPSRRFYWNNDQLGPGDASVLAAMLLKLRPKRVIEVGSGYSSAVMLDIRQSGLAGEFACTFIEPYPNRLKTLLRPGDHAAVRLIEQRLELVDPAVFDALDAGDVLFIDSSHVSKAGSDVNHIVFNLLPRLRPGVVIHFHDIFYPFEYPREWFFNGNRSWNEAYILRAFLMNNPHYRILFFNHFVAYKCQDLRDLMPPFWLNHGGSLWLVKQHPE
ncbi:MAG: class I SAM-dependent methyltransferase [Alphaproteobacteria bacterium]|nr:class I SAM-dependent methyltransferase [Alphaproteobacteria bacterium]